MNISLIELNTGILRNSTGTGTYYVDPCAVAAPKFYVMRRAATYFCGSAKFQSKMEILSASRIFFSAISALTEIESIISNTQ